MRTQQLLVTAAPCQIDQRMLCADSVCVCFYTLTLTHTSHECNSNRVYSLFFCQVNLTVNLKRSTHTSYTPALVARSMPVAYACACLWHTVIWRRVSVNAPGTTALREKLRKTFSAGLPLCIHSNATGAYVDILKGQFCTISQS